ncbi:hypothetical protein C2S52_022658 [Perilla frutescens var. hirtella]|uniref:Uncharacterized protein n=1 Tax=Perilla frutescens var. hirtella TaxID=608512 RepID=A0AAD4P3N6_PERFH|nr:hypothetical protein C2S52_022658 [Perilla frutescens var. hirtella]KAH6806976.1 hypothetical protein C2S51_028084 [Perilla frutescens var. frutescens]KAH6824877.1 hypothetical protein C2S53_013870 [Perilla frutescens var. hirtella]
MSLMKFKEFYFLMLPLSLEKMLTAVIDDVISDSGGGCKEPGQIPGIRLITVVANGGALPGISAE